jgi:hypothetical protein
MEILRADRQETNDCRIVVPLPNFIYSSCAVAFAMPRIGLVLVWNCEQRIRVVLQWPESNRERASFCIYQNEGNTSIAYWQVLRGPSLSALNNGGIVCSNSVRSDVVAISSIGGKQYELIYIPFY